MKFIGQVTYTDGMRIEISDGEKPKPRMKFYADCNPLKLGLGEEVIIEVSRAVRRVVKRVGRGSVGRSMGS